MKKTGKGRGTNRSPLTPVYQMPIFMMLLCLIAAKLLLWKKVPESSMNYIPYIIGALVAFYGAYRGARLAPRHRFLWGLMNVAVFGIMLFMGNLLFFGERFSEIGKMFLWLFTGGILGSFVANAKKGKIA